MERFLVNTPSTHETKAAFEEMLAMEQGNRLTICTGFLGGGGENAWEMQQIVQWLKAKPGRHLSLYFGYWGRYKRDSKLPQGDDWVDLNGHELAFEANDKEQSKLMARAPGLFGTKKFPAALADQLFIVGIRNFHVKAMRLSHFSGNDDKQTLAALIGSSNFTNAAMVKPFQFEMDVFLKADVDRDNPLLEQFSTDLDRMLMSAFPFHAAKATAEFESTTLHPALATLNAEAVEEFLFNEEKALRMRTQQREDAAMRIAYRDSDRTLGISSNDEA